LIGKSERSIERNIKKLQQDGLLKRTGGRKGGHWEVAVSAKTHNLELDSGRNSAL
jgi:predicted HTH transcriptional regulator